MIFCFRSANKKLSTKPKSCYNIGMEKENKTVLVVETDRVWQTRIRNFLKEKGYKVASVDSAQAAVDFCIKNVVDLVLLELNLPDRKSC